MSDASDMVKSLLNRQPVGATSRAPLYTHPSPLCSPSPLVCLFLCQAARLRHSIRRYTPFGISKFCKSFAVSSKEHEQQSRYDTQSSRVCACVCEERERARPSAADCFCTLAHHVNVERSRLCAASRTCEKRDQRSHTQREPERERAPMQRSV